MVFTAPTFLFFFLPLTLLLNYLLKNYKCKNVILLVMSLFFYVFGEGELVLIMMGSITVNYFLGLWIGKKKSKKALIIGVSINILILIVNKYTNFFIENLNHLLSLLDFASIKEVNISLPIGISFYTFQSISYLIDVYRNNNKAQKKLVDLALYISLFPQLVAGPIVRYKDIADQLKNRTQSIDKFTKGLERFIIGLFKKVVISNSLAITVDFIFESDIGLIDSSTGWLAIIMYTLQIYFDFSGYSDMAIGLGKMLGFDFLENFNYPYVSKSIREFWRRWHISLSMWFRDYLYISLGGNRKSNIRTYFNLIIIFVTVGLWHGASWNYVLFGLVHGIFIVIERLGFDKVLNRYKILGNIYTLFVVLIAFVIFRLESVSDSFRYIKTLFISTSEDVHYNVFMFLSKENIVVLVLALIMSFNGLNMAFHYLVKKLKFESEKASSVIEFLKYIGLFLIFIYCIMNVASGSYNPFIYFRF